MVNYTYTQSANKTRLLLFPCIQVVLAQLSSVLRWRVVTLSRTIPGSRWAAVSPGGPGTPITMNFE